MEFNWRCCFNNVIEREYLQELLPRDFKYQVTSFQMLEAPSKIPAENKFTTEMKISTCTVKGVFDFMKEFQGLYPIGCAYCVPDWVHKRCTRSGTISQSTKFRTNAIQGPIGG